MVAEPSLPEVAARWDPVAVFVTDTSAAGSTAPVWSTTTTTRVALFGVWAGAVAAAAHRATARNEIRFGRMVGLLIGRSLPIDYDVVLELARAVRLGPQADASLDGRL